MSQGDANPTADNVRSVAKLEHEALLKRSLASMVSEAVTTGAGSQWSLAVHALWFISWLVMNSGALGTEPFDPFPFSLLTALVSLEAIFLSLFVLASQNRLTREADKRAHLDLQVNLLAEQEMTLTLQMLRELCEHFQLTDTTRSENFLALSTATDVEALAKQVERTLPSEQQS